MRDINKLNNHAIKIKEKMSYFLIRLKINNWNNKNQNKKPHNLNLRTKNKDLKS